VAKLNISVVLGIFYLAPAFLSNIRYLGAAFTSGSQLKQEDPPNLSILLSGGKETNQDSLSKGD
jgi:hypothetical protein